jgi:hypothetical protein
MADAYQKETSVDRYLLEDGAGVYLLEPVATVIYTQLERSVRGLNRGLAEGG